MKDTLSIYSQDLALQIIGDLIGRVQHFKIFISRIPKDSFSKNPAVTKYIIQLFYLKIYGILLRINKETLRDSTLPRQKLLDSLDSMLEHFICLEDYEKCAVIWQYRQVISIDT